MGSGIKLMQVKMAKMPEDDDRSCYMHSFTSNVE